MQPPLDFQDADRQILPDLAHKMRFVGWFFVGAGALSLIAFIVQASVELPPRVVIRGDPLAGIVFLAVGFRAATLARTFAAVLVPNHELAMLRAALEDLRRLYTLKCWLRDVALALGLAALGVGVVSSVITVIGHHTGVGMPLARTDGGHKGGRHAELAVPQMPLAL
jgi:hypothetical protein